MDPDRKYYTELFPAQAVHKFLLRHSTRVFKYREIALRWNIDGKQTWQRFNSYANSGKMKADISRRLPIGIYIGPAYNFDPTLRFVFGLQRLRSVEHKIIFDIDLTDYDDVRSCPCVTKTSGLRCCSTCWPLAACAIIILRNLLRYKFGFHEFLFLFSGSKGAHCWVLDQAGQTWQDTARLHLSAYFRPFIKEFSRAAPMQCAVLEQCYEQVIRPLFEKQIVGTVVDFSTPHGRSLVVRCAQAHDTSITELAFLDQLPSMPNPLNLWKYTEQALLEQLSDGAAVVRSVIMMCTFPRLDKDITTSMQHLIRCPFSINGARGKLCLPIRYQESLAFSPEHAPDSRQLDADVLQPYLDVLEEAMQAPWSRIWVCRECEPEPNYDKYRENHIFTQANDWLRHHNTPGHPQRYSAEESTAKALTYALHRAPTMADKRHIYLTLLKLKQP